MIPDPSETLKIDGEFTQQLQKIICVDIADVPKKPLSAIP